MCQAKLISPPKFGHFELLDFQDTELSTTPPLSLPFRSQMDSVVCKNVVDDAFDNATDFTHQIVKTMIIT